MTNQERVEQYAAKLKKPKRHVKNTVHHLWDNRYRVNVYAKKENGDLVIIESYFVRAEKEEVKVCA